MKTTATSSPLKVAELRRLCEARGLESRVKRGCARDADRRLRARRLRRRRGAAEAIYPPPGAARKRIVSTFSSYNLSMLRC